MWKFAFQNYQITTGLQDITVSLQTKHCIIDKSNYGPNNWHNLKMQFIR